jgi:hypothetical protein
LLGLPLQSASAGLLPFFIDSGMAADGTFNITNNVVVVSNFNAAAQDGPIRGISIGSAASFYNIEHNSIDIFSTTTQGLANRNGTIGTVVAFTGNGGASIRNNILRADVTGTSSAVVNAVGGPITASGNDVYKTAATPLIGTIGGPTYADLASWQAAGYDSVASGGQSVDPKGTSPAWDANLHFPTKPVVGLGVVAASTTLVDVDGDARPATGAYPGADQPTVNTAVGEWSIY